jgi:hypothetical protein
MPSHRLRTRQISSHITANATSISGHQPTGSNASAETAPVSRA